ncbi:MAG: hypothetical protein EA351_02465 [Gemmatimonadales bacterium]|nr:MAG: hypothetical protein EA351_02465 [Gemmatimonadales bacterium]
MMVHPGTRIHRVAPLLLLCSLALWGCDGSTEPTPAPDALQLSQSSVVFSAIDDSVAIQVQVRDQFGEPMDGVASQFTSANPSVATVSSSGVIRASGMGATLVEVSAGEASAFIAVQVEQSPAELAFVGTLPGEAPAGSTVNGVGVRVVDANGYPVAGVPVEFIAHGGVLQGGGSTELRSTGGDGTVEFAWTVPEIADERVGLEVRSGGLPSLGAELMVVAAQPAELRLISGAGQSASRGETLALPHVVRLVDAFENPIEGASVELEVLAGGGALEADAGATDSEGELRVEWTLGSQLGTQRARIRSGGLERVIEAEAVATPDAILLISGGGQSEHRTRTLPDPVRVQVVDEQGMAIPGVSIRTELSDLQGSVNPQLATTDAAGEASFEWTLGEVLGTVTLELSAGSTELVVEAQSVAVAQTLEVIGGDGQTAPAGQAVSTDPQVRLLDEVGLPVPGEPVTFSVTGGGGTVSGGSSASQTTNGQGRASVPWVLGSASAEQSLLVSHSAAPPVGFSATADLSAPTSLAVISGSGQSADPGQTLASPVVVELRDLAGDPVEGIAVSWTASGDGSVGPAATQTNAQGRAQATWTLGSAAGSQSLTASAAGLTATAFAQASAPPDPSSYQIEYDYQSSIDPAVQAVFEAAADRWAQVIVGKLPEVQINISASNSWCTNEDMSRTIDDLLIVVVIEPIDGVGGVLGSAGPCLIRSGSGLPMLGRVRLDEADVNNLLANDMLYDVVLHEIGHVLGIGTLWEMMGLLEDKAAESDPDLDPWFSGAQAIAGFNDVGGNDYTDGNKVPVENTGGSGTRNGHWRQSVLDNELMTGWISGGSSNPLSLVTVGSLADLGYTVDPGAADSFSFSAMIFDRLTGPTIHMGDDIERLPIGVVDEQGRITRTIHPPIEHRH